MHTPIAVLDYLGTYKDLHQTFLSTVAYKTPRYVGFDNRSYTYMPLAHLSSPRYKHPIKSLYYLSCLLEYAWNTRVHSLEDDLSSGAYVLVAAHSVPPRHSPPPHLQNKNQKRKRRYRFPWTGGSRHTDRQTCASSASYLYPAISRVHLIQICRELGIQGRGRVEIDTAPSTTCYINMPIPISPGV